MKLTEKQLRTLEAICETFAPAEDGWPSAREMGVAGAIAAGVPEDGLAGDELLQLLNVWDARLHALFTVGRIGAVFGARDGRTNTHAARLGG